MSKNPPVNQGSRFDFTGYGAGPYLLRSIYRIEVVVPLEAKGVVSLQSTTSDGKTVVLYISAHAAELLMQAPAIVSDMSETQPQLKVLDLTGMPEPIEFPLLVEFLSSATRPLAERLLCFQCDEGQHFCFLISSGAYQSLLDALRNALQPV